MPNYTSTCLSSSPDHVVADILLHYFGCLGEVERKEFFRSLTSEKKERIMAEQRRIWKLRVLFENEETTKDLARKFKTSLRKWYSKSCRFSDEHTTEYQSFEKLCKENCFGMDAHMIFYKNSRPFSIEGYEGRFPNQTISMKDLLYNQGDYEKNPLMKPCEEGMIRYFIFQRTTWNGSRYA